jgi:hypothetical protein
MLTHLQWIDGSTVIVFDYIDLDYQVDYNETIREDKANERL